MSITLFKVENKTIIRSADNEFDPSGIYIIVDRTPVRPKIWVWSGPNSNIKDRYFAGVSATTVKSQEKLYGSSIEVVEGGAEPEQFPKMDEVRILAPIEGELEIGERILLQGEQNEEKTIEEEFDSLEIPSEEFETSADETTKSEWGPDRLARQKIKGLLGDISHDLEEIRNKIESFLTEL